MDGNAPGKEKFSLTPNEGELHRQLIDQFYERSVGQYGIDSEQARMFSLVLAPMLTGFGIGPV